MPGNDAMAEVSPHNPSVAVIIPTFNEAESIPAVVAEIPRTLVDRVIVADGGSGDGTPERAREAGAEVIAAGRGYGRACRAGAQAWRAGIIVSLAGERGAAAESVVSMAGDGADDPAAIAALIGPLANGDCDFVIASRARGRREPGSMAWHQLIAGELIGFLTGLLYGVRYTDMCALR